MQNFRDWFYMNANELLEGWLRAKEDGNESPDFKDYIFGEYEFYTECPDEYEVPYHGLFDAESKSEKVIKILQLGITQLA